MQRKDKIKSLLTFYKCKLANKYYSDDAERIFLEEKIKHFEKILGEWENESKRNNSKDKKEFKKLQKEYFKSLND